MSVAFTREEDYESTAADLPDRPISPHPNLVTPEGLALIEAALVEARAAMTSPKSGGDVSADRTAMAHRRRGRARPGEGQRLVDLAAGSGAAGQVRRRRGDGGGGQRRDRGDR